MATKRDIRLVKNQRETKKKIASPLAKYNSAGQLYCVLCNIPVKSAILWDSHVLGKKHKENLAIFKGKSNKSQTVTDVQQSTKQNADDSTFVRPVLKRTNPDKIDTEENTPDKKMKVDSGEKTNSLKEREEEVNTNNSNDADGLSGLPSAVGVSVSPQSSPSQKIAGALEHLWLQKDFFDTQHKSDQTAQTPKVSDEDSTEGIPEGFFDDPKLDAKVRKVEYKDPAEEEWEKFQKAMQVETQVSQSIVEGEDEESRVDREFSELNEQRLYFLRADALRDKQSAIQEKVSKQEALQKQTKEENASDSDDSDYEEFFDWRAKKVS